MKLKQYLDAHGLSQTEFGKRLNVTQGAVWQWLKWLDDPKRGTRITAERAADIEGATDGAVTRHELRPDLFPEAAPTPQCPQPAVDQAIEAAGGTAAMAEACNSSTLEVSNWRHLGVPEDKVARLCEASKGAVSAHEIPVQKARAAA